MDYTIDETGIFSRMPVFRAVLALVVPTVLSQLITVIYNMADTFFIGQLGDPNQVAAASLALPLFILNTAMANLFGIGGASLISRSLGIGNETRARRASAFCAWTASGVAMALGLLLFVFRGTILPAVGANEETYLFASQYVFWTITVGAVPTVLSAALAHLIRAEGLSAQASFGIALGGVLNIVLDPVFIFTFGLEIQGAAIATMISNVLAMGYFALLLRRRRGELHLSFRLRDYTVKNGIPAEVLFVGLPGAAMNLMGCVSNVALNRLMVSYCNEALAGIGIAKKIDMVAFAVANGLSQGVIPLIGFNFGAGNYPRMRSAIRVTLLLSLSVTTVGAVLLFTCAGPLVGTFIEDPLTVRYGSVFQRIICITGPFTGIAAIIIGIFQAVGQKFQPLLLSMLRKGGLDVPLMLLLNHYVGIYGIAWATPIADLCAMAVGLALFVPFWRRLGRESVSAAQKKYADTHTNI